MTGPTRWVAVGGVTAALAAPLAAGFFAPWTRVSLFLGATLPLLALVLAWQATRPRAKALATEVLWALLIAVLMSAVLLQCVTLVLELWAGSVGSHWLQGGGLLSRRVSAVGGLCAGIFVIALALRLGRRRPEDVD